MLVSTYMRARTALPLAGLLALVPLGAKAGQHFLNPITPVLASAEGASERPLSPQMGEIVANYRKIIVLMAEDGALDPVTEEPAAMLGRMLFEENQERLGTLTTSLTVEITRHQSALYDSFLGDLESNPQLHDADKLVFRDLLEDLSAVSISASDTNLEKRLHADAGALDAVRGVEAVCGGGSVADNALPG